VETEGVEARTSTTDDVEARNSTTQGVEARTSTKDKGKEKYESDDNSDYPSDKSIDYLSPGEDELIKLRNRMKANRKAKAKAKDKLDEEINEPNEENSMPADNVRGETFEEHDIYMNKLLKSLKTVGEKYTSFAQFKECLTYYALANGFSLWHERSGEVRVVAKCGQRPPRVSDPKKDEHTCVRNFNFGALVNYKWIAKIFGDKIRSNPDIRLCDIADLVMKKYKCKILWKAILDSNHGSTVKLGVTVNLDGKTYFDRFWHVIHAGGNHYEVRSGSEGFTVDEGKRTCSCRMWQLSGLPCVHAIKVIFLINKVSESYVIAWFETYMYFVAYHNYVKLVPGMNFWPKQSMYSTVLPPKPRKMPGGPRKKRIRAIGEGGSSTRVSKVGSQGIFSNYKKPGHNKSSCKEPVVEQTPKPKGVIGRHRKKEPVDDFEDVDVVQRGPVRDEGASGTKGGAIRSKGRGGRRGVAGSRGGASGSIGRGAGLVGQEVEVLWKPYDHLSLV
ncbi:multidrug resistance-associated protein 5, partial [Tanacetum coccineum]